MTEYNFAFFANHVVGHKLRLTGAQGLLPADIKLLMDFLAVYPELTALDLDHTFINNESMLELAQGLPQTRVTQLNLAHNSLTDNSLRQLILLLPMTQLTHLNLESCSIDFATIEELIAVLPRTRLSELNLSKVNNSGLYFSIACMRMLVQVLHLTQLTCLDLSQNYITNECLQLLAPVLAQSKLKQLKFAHNVLNAEGARILAFVLSQTNLELLDLSHCSLGNEGVQRLVEVLAGTQLKILILKGNIISQGMHELAAVLPDSQLIELNINLNPLPIEEILALVQILPQTKLRKFDIGFTKSGDVVVEELAKIASQTQLTIVNLDRIHCTETSVRKLLEVIPQTKLTDISFSFNKLDYRGDLMLEVDTRLKYNKLKVQMAAELLAFMVAVTEKIPFLYIKKEMEYNANPALVQLIKYWQIVEGLPTDMQNLLARRTFGLTGEVTSTELAAAVTNLYKTMKQNSSERLVPISESPSEEHESTPLLNNTMGRGQDKSNNEGPPQVPCCCVS